MNRDSLASVSTERSSISLSKNVVLTTNRQTKYKLYTGNLDETGKEAGVSNYSSFNYQHKCLAAFHTSVQKIVRLSPSAPTVDVTLVKLKRCDGVYEAVTQDNLDSLINDILHQQPNQHIFMKVLFLNIEINL
jgi:hypothetical protein